MSPEQLRDLIRLSLSYFRKDDPIKERTIQRGRRRGQTVTVHGFKGTVTMPFTHGKKANILVDAQTQGVTIEHMESIASHLALSADEVNLRVFTVPVEGDGSGLFLPDSDYFLQPRSFTGKALRAIIDAMGFNSVDDWLDVNEADPLGWLHIQVPGWVLDENS